MSSVREGGVSHTDGLALDRKRCETRQGFERWGPSEVSVLCPVGSGALRWPLPQEGGDGERGSR